MSYSCTQAAHLTLQRTMNLALSTNIHTLQTSNTWYGEDGKEYFYERGRENDDGRITGSVYDMHGKYCGQLHISAYGRVIKWAKMPKKHIRYFDDQIEDLAKGNLINK